MANLINTIKCIFGKAPNKAAKRKAFFDAYRKTYGPLNQLQVDGLTFLLDKLDEDLRVVDKRQQAYILATVKHETADTYQPIEEYGKGYGKAYGIVYFGRGYVQLTWEANYKTMSTALNQDLVYRPELALQPENAYEIMIRGMTKGMFTGRSLSDYINDKQCDYVNARKVVNRLDKAALISRYAMFFESVL